MEEVISQSGSFIFQNGVVFTYNEEVACRAKSGLDPEFTGAVKAKAFMDLLRKMPDEDLNLDVKGGRFIIYGGENRRARLNMDAEITIPIGGLEKPNKEDWQPVHEEFNDAVGIVQNVAGKDASQFVGTCINITPNYIEATDGFQVAKYKLETGVKENVLVKKNALKHVIPLDVTKLCETQRWIHFKNPAGVVLSIQRHLDPFPDLRKNFKVKGTPAALPKGIAQAVATAGIFSRENADANLLIINLKKGKMIVTGLGTSGDYSEKYPANYDGPGMSFTIPPEILTEISKKHSECILTPKRLKVEGGKWEYVTSLGSPTDMMDKPTKKDDDGSVEKTEEDTE